MSLMKEADVLKHKSQVFSTMQRHQHNQLWAGLLNGKLVFYIYIISIMIYIYIIFLDKFDQFWSENKKLMEPLEEAKHFKYIPVHFYRSGSIDMTQTLVKPVLDDGSLIKLGELIKQTYPSLDNRKFIDV